MNGSSPFGCCLLPNLGHHSEKVISVNTDIHKICKSPIGLYADVIRSCSYKRLTLNGDLCMVDHLVNGRVCWIPVTVTVSPRLTVEGKDKDFTFYTKQMQDAAGPHSRGSVTQSRD